MSYIRPDGINVKSLDPAAPAPLPGHVNKEVEKTWPGNEDEDHAA